MGVSGPDGAAAPGRFSALNAGAVVVAGLYFGRELLVPIALAVLLAFVLAPLVAVLQRARLGRTLPVMLTVVVAFAAIGGIGLVVGRQAQSLAQGFTAYEATILQKAASLPIGKTLSGQVQQSLAGLLGTAGDSVRAAGGARRAKPVAVAVATADEAPTTLMLVRSVVQPLLGPLATIGVVLIFVIFVLLFREDLRDRLVRLVGRQDLHRTILAMNDAARRLSRYFLIQVALNAGFGAFIASGLALAGLPNPVLWGILAALMRFLPFIGTFIAVGPPLVLALAVAPGWGLAVVVMALFGLSEIVMGQVIEPLQYGHSTGLSPVAVIISASFWALLWGPVGLLLATPLTVLLVVIGRHVESLEFLDVMLGDAPPLDPQEIFYQRALEGNARLLGQQARLAVRATSLVEYYDRVAMRGLALAQADLARDALSFDRLEALHGHVQTLIAGLDPGAPRLDSQSPLDGDLPPDSALPEGWRQEGAVLCIAGRGPLDDLAAAMSRQALRGAGFGARCETNLVLRGEAAGAEPHEAVRLVCLSVLEEGSSASATKYLLRRIARRMPQAAVVVGLWHADGASPSLAMLRTQGSAQDGKEATAGEMIVLSLSELVALARAICARRERAIIGGRVGGGGETESSMRASASISCG